MSQNKITLTKDQADAFGRELDAIKEREMADLGEKDAEYIRRLAAATGRSPETVAEILQQRKEVRANT